MRIKSASRSANKRLTANFKYYRLFADRLVCFEIRADLVLKS